MTHAIPARTRTEAPPHPRLGWLPLLLALALGAFTLLSRVRRDEHLVWTFATVALALAAWFVVLRVHARSAGRSLDAEVVPPVRQHYIQAAVQLVLYTWWGSAWVVDGVHPIFDQAPLILAQLVYLYTFDALWSWSRGRAWRIASGPMPIALSTNLFIWFEDHVFHWQFAMVTAGLLGKEFVRWNREGRRTHVFNPSGFGLMCAATALILTDSTDLTWANALASELEVRHIFVVLFVLGLVVQWFFAVTLMTFAAAIAMVASNLLYTEFTGVYLFASSNLPAAAFLGLMLLMTDPSTSPRTNVGRTLFGFGYGIGYVVFFELLGRIGAPELYAKLYPVPILNCTVRLLDRIARTGVVGRINARWEHGRPARVTNAVHIGLWSSMFAVLFFTGYLDGPHPGRSILFWKRAVHERRHEAERKLVMVTGSQATAASVPTDHRAAAYNELGIQSMTSHADAASPEARIGSAARWFAQAADLGSDAGQLNVLQHFLQHRARRDDATLGRALQRAQQLALAGDGQAAFLIGLAIETGVGVAPDARGALTFYRRCGDDDPFAQKAIARIGLAPGNTLDLRGAAAVLGPLSEAGDGEAAYYLAHMHRLGRGVEADPERAATLLQRAAAAGFEPAKLAVQQRTDDLPPFTSPRRKHLAFPPWATAYPLAH